MHAIRGEARCHRLDPIGIGVLRRDRVGGRIEEVEQWQRVADRVLPVHDPERPLAVEHHVRKSKIAVARHDGARFSGRPRAESSETFEVRDGEPVAELGGGPENETLEVVGPEHSSRGRGAGPVIEPVGELLLDSAG